MDSHPYATLDRCQSRRVSTVPVGEALQVLMARKMEAPPYEDLINFPRAKDKDEIRCVMCGLPPGMNCVIPRQNKDVCKECDKSTWVHTNTSVYFKWCKGCKKFLRLGSFSEKLDAAKCDRCRERGRQSYLLKKGKDGATLCVVGGRSRSNSDVSCNSDIEIQLSDSLVSAAAAALMSAGKVSSGMVSSSSVSGHSSDEDEDRSPNDSDGEDTGSRRRRRRRLLQSQHVLQAPSPYGDTTGDDADTLRMAHAVVSLSSSNFRTSDISASSSSSCEAPVLIDDEKADVSRSKLSSVFGKPLRELKRTCSPPSERGGDAERDMDTSVSSEAGGGSCEDAGRAHVGKALCGTLYELACIHQRIVTLEEHAARVKSLEDTICAQRTEMGTLRADVSRLEGELAAAKQREESSRDEAEAMRIECEAIRAALPKLQQPNKSTEAVATAGVGVAEACLESSEAAQGNDAEIAALLEETGALAKLTEAIDRVRKRPRLVSVG